MSGWVTKVTFSGAMKGAVDPALPTKAERRIDPYWPYRLIAGVATLSDWDWVRSRILMNGAQAVWCRLHVPDDPGLAIPGATYYGGDIPEIPEYVEPPVPVSAQFKTDLSAAATALQALLDDPEWDFFVARFAQLTQEELEATAAFRRARDLRDKLGMLTHG